MFRLITKLLCTNATASIRRFSSTPSEEASTAYHTQAFNLYRASAQRSVYHASLLDHENICTDYPL